MLKVDDVVLIHTPGFDDDTGYIKEVISLTTFKIALLNREGLFVYPKSVLKPIGLTRSEYMENMTNA